MRKKNKTKLSDPSSILEHLNRAYSELSKVRFTAKSFALNEKEHARLIEIFKLMGRIRLESLSGD
jgi:hypothetical protein